MAKLTLSDLANLQNEQTAVSTINANNAATETALENTLSRDGTTPNQMNSALDMNSNRITNLVTPLGSTEPVRLGDMTSFGVGGTFTPLPTGGTTNQTLKKNSNANYDVGWGNGTGVTSVGLTMPADFNVTGSPVTSAGTLAVTLANTATGTGGIVRQTSPTLVTPNLGTPSAAVLTSATGLPLSGLTNQNAFTIVGNNTSGSAAPTAVDIATLTTKATPAAGDYVMLSDQAASGAWKKATVSSVGASAGVSSIAGNTGSFTLGAGLTNTVNDIQVVAGSIVGTAFGTYTANTSLSVAIPVDNTIPQISEGTQIISVSYTPRYINSILLCIFSGEVGIGATPDNGVVALFNGAANSFSSIVLSLGASFQTPVLLQGSYSPGSLSAQTITVRAGASAQPIAFNGRPSTPFLGGASIATLTIHEIKV